MATTESIEVLITDGNRRPALAVARSLARRGISLTVVSDERRSLSACSRHVKHTAIAPDPSSDPDGFMDRILELVRLHHIRLVIPVLDPSLLALASRRDELESLCSVGTASPEALRAVLDKRINLNLARRLGIPCAREYTLQTNDQIPEMIRELGFPLVMKPPGSPGDRSLPDFPFKVLYANNETQLRDYIDRYCHAGMYPLFQSFVVGTPRNLCCMVIDGDIVAMYEHRSQRVLKGQGVLRTIVEPTTAAVKYARAMYAELRWTGVAQFCFFLNEATNGITYMETNGRFWSSIAGGINAGWDIPYWLYRYFRHGERPAPPPIRLGSQTCWHRGDLVALFNYLAGGESPTKGQDPGKLRACADYLAGFKPGIAGDVFNWRDPLPGIIDHWQLLRRGLASLGAGRQRDARRLSSPDTDQ